jgi:hypothetical protein
MLWTYGLKIPTSPKESIREALELAQKAVALDHSNAFAHGLMGYVYNNDRAT